MLFKPTQISCDWLTASQTFTTPIKPINDGLVQFISADGELINTTHKSLQLLGSHSTSVQIRSDGFRLEYSGNPSRHNRLDNVYGLDLNQAKKSVNQLLLTQGLPPFDEGETTRLNDGTITTTGATASRIDMAAICATGSPDNLVDYLYSKSKINIKHYLTTRKFNTVYWGASSKTKTIKIYDKALELKKHLKKCDNQQYLLGLINHLHDIGAFRIETAFRYRYLKNHNLRHWNQCTHENLFQHFKQDLKIMTKPIEKLNIDNLTGAQLGTLMIYLAGIDPKTRLAKDTFYKHKKILLEYGYDISCSDVLSRINTTPTLVTLSAPAPPDWYKHPKSFKQLKLA